jgi:hypothetical protein
MKHPKCDFALCDSPAVSNIISSKIIDRDAFSLVRLGDGEGLLLSISAQSSDTDFGYLKGHLSPQGVGLNDLLNLKRRLIAAIYDADIIGIRNDIVDVEFDPANFSLTPEEFLITFRRSFRLRQGEQNLNYHSSRRVSFLHQSLGDLDFDGSNQFCSAWFHYDYHNSREIFKVLKHQKRIGLISCRQRLPCLLEKSFDLSVNFHQIPDMFRDISDQNIAPNYIEQLENVLKQKLVEFPGMLYLVGGGLYGKLYCQLIKAQGGIALDLGALFDAWLGIPTRPAVYKSMYGNGPEQNEVPSSLLLNKQNIEL